jgi:hypothetical protein
VLNTSVPGLDLVPAALALSGAEVELVGLPAREHRLSASLADLVNDTIACSSTSRPRSGC